MREGLESGRKELIVFRVEESLIWIFERDGLKEGNRKAERGGTCGGENLVAFFLVWVTPHSGGIRMSGTEREY